MYWQHLELVLFKFQMFHFWNKILHFKESDVARISGCECVQLAHVTGVLQCQVSRLQSRPNFELSQLNYGSSAVCVCVCWCFGKNIHRGMYCFTRWNTLGKCLPHEASRLRRLINILVFSLIGWVSIWIVQALKNDPLKKRLNVP